MPDRVLAATERQFRDILQTAMPDREIELRLFQIAGIKRHPETLEAMASRYQPADAVADAGLSALVVTGAKAGDGPLKQSPYWPGFARLVDLTQSLQLSTLWSCLAAHAAIERLDGIQRRPLGDKCSGFFDCSPNRSHPLLQGVERNWRIPHSRYNGVSADELTSHGYEILTAAGDAGPDVFIKQGPPLYVFCQGHPEYDRDSLLQEYKRDVRAYAHGTRGHAPAPPTGALDAEMARSFQRLTRDAAVRRAPEDTATGELALAERPPEWRPFTIGLYRNWIRAVI